MPTLIIDANPFDESERTVKHIPKNRRIAAMCPSSRYPVVCWYNGKPLLRKGWNRRVKHGDVVAFIAYQRGGGGGFLRTIASIGMIFAAPYLAQMALGTTFGAYAATALGGNSTFLSVAGGLIGLAGNMLFNAILPGPKQPSQQSFAADMQAASPTYSLTAQGNSARLDQPIPVQYGRTRGYLDFAASPYQEFSGNQQYLYQLLVVGQGAHAIEKIQIEDTDIQNFSGAVWEVLQPGQRVTLFPVNVVQSVEVAGAELLTNATLGGYTVNQAGTKINAVGFDLVFPGGLYYANDQGTLDTRSVTVQFEVRKIDDVGLPLGGWTVVGNETISEATNTAIRRSYRYAVADGRYEGRATRVNAKDTSSRAANVVNWAGMRGYMPDTTDFGNVTMLAVRLLADAQLSAQAARKINVISTRMLPTWNPNTGWSAPVATRSIAWALADICRASYGAAMGDDAYHLAGLYALDQTWAARGDTFDARFDTKGTVGEALSIVARAGRSKWYQQGGMVRFWRDQPQSIPKMVFSADNIVEGSFQMHFSPVVSDSSDAVRLTYLDERFWAPRDVDCVPAGSLGNRPQTFNAFGMQKREQVVREGMHMAECSRRRRVFASFSVEREGEIPGYGALIGVSHDMPGWGQSGHCIGWDQAAKRLFVSNPLVWVDGENHFVRLVRRNGQPTAKIQVTKDPVYENAVILASDPTTGDGAMAIETAAGPRERTRYLFGTSSQIYVEMLVMSVKPQKGNNGPRYQIEGVVDDPLVHQAENMTLPDAPGMTLPSVPSAPTVTGLIVNEVGTPAAPVLQLSWNPAPGAAYYCCEYTLDGLTWRRFAEPSVNGADLVGVTPGLVVNVRVAGVGLLRGGWAYWTGTAGATVAAPGKVTGLVLESDFVGPAVTIRWDATPRANRYRVETWQGGAKRGERWVNEPRFTYRVEDAAVDGGPWRAFEFRVVPLGVGAGGYASIQVSNPPVPQLNNILVAANTGGAVWSCDPPPDPDLSGYLVYASTLSGFTPGPSNLVGEFSGPVGQLNLPAGYTWRLRFAAADRWGRDGLNISGEFSVSPGKIVSTQISDGAILTPHLGAGTVTAEKMLVTRLSAVSTDLGTVNTGAFNVTSDGLGGYGYARSAGKWWGDGANGWIFARNVAGETFAEIKAGSGRLWFSSWGDYGIQMPGISMGPSGVTLSQLNVVGTSQIQGNAVTLSSAASGGGGASLTITVPPEASGQPVIVLCSGTNNQDGAGGYTAWNARRWYRLYRNGVELRLVRDIQENTSFAAHDLATAFTHLDYPGVGTHTYTLWVRNWKDSDVAWGTSVNIVCSLGKR